MQPLTPADIRAALVNVTKSERAALTVPVGFERTEWGVLDFYGWRDPKFPQRGYLVRTRDEPPTAVAVSTTGSGPPGRKSMCNICHAVDNSTAVALFTARRAGPTGRNGNTVGIYICTDLNCSAQLRQPNNRAGRIRLDTDEDVDAAAAEMLERLDVFIAAVRT